MTFLPVRPPAEAHAVVVAARSMVRLRLVVGTVGNVSARVGSSFVITPTRTDYERVEPDDLPVVGLGPHDPSAPDCSRESPLHAAIYRARPDVGAIVHTHSVHATAWSFLNEPLGPALEENEYYGTGAIRTSRPAPAGSQALGDQAVEALGNSAAVLLGRHGVAAVGATPGEALTIAQVVEVQAQVAWLLRRGSRATVSNLERPQ